MWDDGTPVTDRDNMRPNHNAGHRLWYNQSEWGVLAN
jgi:hypothetical protein